MVLRFVCEYAGKNYCGFQRQKNGIAVQEVLESALAKYFSKTIKIAGSGRTDAGVHAREQICSFTIDSNLPHLNLFQLATAVNAFLPDDIAVRDFQYAQENFHAQFSAKSKTYVYKCYINPFRSPLRKSNFLQIYKPLDIAKMRKAASLLEGTHNFKAFCSEQTDKTDFIRTIYQFAITVENDEIHFTIKGNGFLRNMVRILVGTLLDVGAGKLSPEEFAIILEKGDRKKAGKTAPAHGLTLFCVEY